MSLFPFLQEVVSDFNEGVVWPHRMRFLKLLWQRVLAVNMEVATYARYSGIGLPTTDAECVISLSDDRIAILGHHAQITRLQIEVNLLRSAGLEMNAMKSAESNAGRALFIREFEIKLHYFVSRDVAGVGDGRVSTEWLSCRQ